MGNHKKRLIVICCIFLLILIGGLFVYRQISEQVRYKVTQCSNFSDFVQDGGKRIAFESSSTKCVKYFFEYEKYTDEQKSDFIDRVETLRTFLQNKSKISFKEPVSIYISEKNMFQGKDRKIFLNDMTIESVDVTVAFLQAVYGCNTNYGLCYGISCYINENLYGDVLTPNILNEELGQYYNSKENLSIMDLTIPTFQIVYFTEEQNKYAYSTAYSFIKDLIERKGLKYSVNLLNNSAKFDIDFDKEYTSEKNIWLKSIGATQSCEVPTMTLRYEVVLGNKKSKTYPYAIYTSSTKSCFQLGKYDDEQKQNFIIKIQDICTLLEDDFGISFEDPLTIYASEDNIFKGLDKTIYLKDLNVKSMDVIIATLQSLYGSKSNYGLCYGISCYINEKLYSDSITPNISIKELGQYYSSDKNLSIMDLTIPVFQTVYFTEEQNEYAYSTAYYFVKDIIERKGTKYTIELLGSSSELDIDFDKECTNEKNIWLESIGAEQRCEVLKTPIRYELNLDNKEGCYPYIIYSPTIKSYITSDVNEFKDEEIVMDYDYIKHYLNMYEADISALKKYLSPYFDTNKDVINCYFKHMKKFGGYYTPDVSIQYSLPLWNGVHEYTHYITWDSSLPKWMVEGIAEYCSNYIENQDVCRMKKEFYDNYYCNSNSKINYYSKKLASSNEKVSKSNLEFRYEIYAYKYSQRDTSSISLDYYYDGKYKDEEGIDLTYQQVGSLVNYLIETYGEEKYFELYKDYSKLSEIYDGKTFNELKEEWQIKLNSLFNMNYILGPNETKIKYDDLREVFSSTKPTFADSLDGNIYEYEYVYCGSDDDSNQNVNIFDGVNVKNKIVLIQNEAEEITEFSKQVNNAIEAGAVGIILYGNWYGFSSNLDEITGDIPIIFISDENYKILKEALVKKISVSKDFVE